MKFRFVLVVLCLFLLSLPSFAQDTQTGEWGDLGLEFEFPDDWDLDDSGDNALVVIYNDELAIYFYEPREADDPEEAIEQLIENNEGTDFEFGDIEEAEVMGEEAFRVSYESEGFSGFSLSFEYEGDVLLLDAGIFDDSLSSSDEDTLLEIIETIQPSEGGNSNNNNNGGGDSVESAADEDSSGEDIVEELVELGLVEDGGDFILEEDEIEEETLDFAESYEGGAIAIGALLSLEAAEDDEDYRFCTLIAQSSTDDLEAEEGTMLITGFDSTGVFLAYEFDIADEDNSNFEAFDPGVDIEDTNHVLLIIQDDELSAYINGELLVEGWELNASAGDDELFTGFIVNEGCSMTNVWAYSFE